MRLESFLLPSKKSLNVIKAIHHLLELRLHVSPHTSRKYCRLVSLARCALPWTGFLSHSWEKPDWNNNDQKNRESLVAPDIHNPRPATFSHFFACNPHLSKTTRSADHISTLRICR